MQPVRMKTDVPTDLEGIRRLLLAMAPKLEARQPGITAQLEQYRFDQPMAMAGRSGETVMVRFEPSGDHTAIKVEVTPPFKPLGKFRGRFWHWRTRWMVKLALKRAKLEVERRAKLPLQPEVLPPER